MPRRSRKRPPPSIAVAHAVLRGGLVFFLVPELAVLPGLSLDFQHWLYLRQQSDLLVVQLPREVGTGVGGRSSSVGDAVRGRRPSSSFTAEAAVIPNNAPFVDDGMFDPRRDYWGDRSPGSTSLSSASASQNWTSGGCAVLCCVCYSTCVCS